MRNFVLAAAVGLFSTAFAAPASAQEAVELGWARQFMGTWAVTIEVPDGNLPLVLTVGEKEGKVTVELSNERQPGSLAITNLSRSDDSLVARYETQYEAMAISAAIRMKRDGDALVTNWQFADGAYETSAKATKK